MKIGGVQKVSLIDFPGKVAATVFTQGCNFRCQFCHNESLVLPEKFEKSIAEEEFFEFLRKRAGRLDGVVVSGGEPTIHADLAEFLRKIKNLGFSIKLDTNGTHPEILKNLYAEHLLDYIAMDIKHRFEAYGEIVAATVDVEAIKHSVAMIREWDLDYEFRTTVVPEFHSADDVKAIALQLSGAKKFVIQEFVADHAINKNLRGENSIFSPENRKTLDDIAKFCRLHVETFRWHPAH
jgi:pyruvate formate lyase activating enzyme